ncbi:hypothetical protein [Salinigranum salinum]|uniref:hypothetical protein n=1 Tax=Salinigranum salinum TaxID=1364937 RepID=UPI00186563C4|nr:hypothetical protein [Salinigranum salinum]
MSEGESEREEPATGVSGDEMADAADERRHLHDLEPGAGCAEIWEHLSERREHAESD